jgi:hypothetical protein
MAKTPFARSLKPDQRLAPELQEREKRPSVRTLSTHHQDGRQRIAQWVIVGSSDFACSIHLATWLALGT